MSVDEAQAPTSGEWYCDQCGRRYTGPGVCDNEHPPSELKPIDGTGAATDEAAASVGGDEPADATSSPAIAGEQEAAATAATDIADATAASDPSPASDLPVKVEPSVLQKAKDALDRAAQAVADAAALIASKLEE